MITDEKINEIRRQLKKGTPGGELKEALSLEGYSEEDIEKVFAPKSYNMQSWYLTFAILFLLVGAYRAIAGGGFLLLILSAGLFFQYLREKGRLKNL